MASYAPGDHVHVASFGTGIVREVRNNGRFLVDVKGRAMEVAEPQLSPLVDQRGSPGAAVRRGRPSGRPKSEAPEDTALVGSRVVSLDLHGHTVGEALEMLDACLSDALLAGASELRVIHGKSGGRVKSAVLRRLQELSVVRHARLDPHNAGVTIVAL